MKSANTHRDMTKPRNALTNNARIIGEINFKERKETTNAFGGGGGRMPQA